MAEAIEASDPEAADTQPAALAHHCYQAGSLADADKTLLHLTTAGQQARAAAAFEEAVGHFSSALSFDRIDKTRRATLLSERGWTLRSLGQTEDAIADCQTALAIHERTGDAATMARTAWDLWWMLAWKERLSEAKSVAERTERAVPDETTPERARALTLLAGSYALVDDGDYGQYEQRGQEAQTIAEHVGDQRLLADVLEQRVTFDRAFAKTRQMGATGRDAIAASRAAGNVWGLANTLSQLGFGLIYAGTPEEASHAADEAEQLGIPIGYDGAIGNVASVRWRATAMRNGDLHEMEQLARSATATFRAMGGWVYYGPVMESKTCFWKGDWIAANRLSDESMAKIPDGASQIYTAWVRGWKLVLQAYEGDGTWIDRFRHQREALIRPDRTLFEGDVLFVLDAVDALAVAGEREDAFGLYEPLRTILGNGFIAGESLTEMACAIASASGQQWSTAQEHFETALRQARDIPYTLAQPEVRRWYAWMLLDRDAPGDHERARTLLGEALELYEAIGMPKHVEIAEKMLRS